MNELINFLLNARNIGVLSEDFSSTRKFNKRHKRYRLDEISDGISSRLQAHLATVGRGRLTWLLREAQDSYRVAKTDTL